MYIDNIGLEISVNQVERFCRDRFGGLVRDSAKPAVGLDRRYAGECCRQFSV